MDYDAIPVAPGGEGFLGHDAAFRRDRLGSLRVLAEHVDRADGASGLYRLRLPLPLLRVTLVATPDAVQEVLVEHARSFDKSDMLRYGLRELAGEGLFTSNGELWRRQRRVMAPLFQPKGLEAYAADMVACALRTVDAWRDGQALSLSHEATRLTMGIAGKTLFDADTFSEADEIGRALTAALGWTSWAVGRPLSIAHIAAKRAAGRLAARTGPGMLHDLFEHAGERLAGPLLLFGRRNRELVEAVRFLDAHVQGMIDERRRAGHGTGDLLTRLLEARDDDGRAMSDRQVRDEVLTLFVAGHETTATGLAWTLYLASKHPEVMAGMVREADAVGDAPGVADLPRLGLCLRAFKEALRLYPPVYAFGRDSTAPVTVAGYRLPVPTNALVCPWILHHTARSYPDPERFDPDRFLPEHEAARHRYAYLPFGAGPRVCLGNHFAYMEAQLALAVILRRWGFELLGDDVPEPGATLRARDGVRVRVRRRERTGVAVGEATVG